MEEKKECLNQNNLKVSEEILNILDNWNILEQYEILEEVCEGLDKRKEIFLEEADYRISKEKEYLNKIVKLNFNLKNQ